jgi:hypothetical protein
MISKETKNTHGLILFFCIRESAISSLQYFYAKNHRTDLSHLTLIVIGVR